MAFCPQCRSEFRKEITVCPTCNLDLVEEADLPVQLSDEEVIAAMAEQEVVTLAEGTLQGLKPVQERLIAAGFPAALRKSDEMMTEAGLFLRLELLVRKSDAEEAGGLVREALQGEVSDEMMDGIARLRGTAGADPGDAEGEEGEGGEAGEGEPLACPACGSTDPLVEGECPECGLFLGGGEEEGEDEEP